jgi:hypothetical protein
MRKYNVPNAYEKLKDLTRGNRVSAESLRKFVDSLRASGDVPAHELDRLQVWQIDRTAPLRSQLANALDTLTQALPPPCARSATLPSLARSLDSRTRAPPRCARAMPMLGHTRVHAGSHTGDLHRERSGGRTRSVKACAPRTRVLAAAPSLRACLVGDDVPLSIPLYPSIHGVNKSVFFLSVAPRVPVIFGVIGKSQIFSTLSLLTS